MAKTKPNKSTEIDTNEDKYLPESTSEMVSNFEHLSAEAAEIEVKPRITLEEDKDSIVMAVAANDAAVKVKYGADRTSHKAWGPILTPLLNEMKECWDGGENATANVSAIVFEIGKRSEAFNALQKMSDEGKLGTLNVAEHAALKRMRGYFIDGMNRFAETHLGGEDDPRIRFKQAKEADFNDGKWYLGWYNAKVDPAEYDISSAETRVTELAEIVAGWGNSVSRPVSKEDIIQIMGLYARDGEGNVITEKHDGKNVKVELPKAAMMENAFYRAFFNKRLMLTKKPS